MSKTYRSAGLQLLALLCALPLGSTLAVAQTAPPIHGVTGTMATDATIRSEHEAANKIAEGAGKVVDGAKKALPGGKRTKQNPLDAFIEGRRVVLQDKAQGDGEAPKTTEGVVVDVNRGRKQITVRVDDGKTQTLRVVAPDTPTDVVMSCTDKAGAKVAHDFKRVS